MGSFQRTLIPILLMLVTFCHSVPKNPTQEPADPTPPVPKQSWPGRLANLPVRYPYISGPLLLSGAVGGASYFALRPNRKNTTLGPDYNSTQNQSTNANTTKASLETTTDRHFSLTEILVILGAATVTTVALIGLGILCYTLYQQAIASELNSLGLVDGTTTIQVTNRKSKKTSKETTTTTGGDGHSSK